MNEKDLKKLSRQELLELLLSQSKKIDRLQAQLNQTEAQLKDKNIAIKESGNIAEVAMKLSGFFDAAQNASDFYIEQSRMLYEQAQSEYDRIVSEAKTTAERIVKGVLNPYDLNLDEDFQKFTVQGITVENAEENVTDSSFDLQIPDFDTDNNSKRFFRNLKKRLSKSLSKN